MEFKICIKKFTKDKLEVKIFETRGEMGAKAADDVEFDDDINIKHVFVGGVKY